MCLQGETNYYVTVGILWYVTLLAHVFRSADFSSIEIDNFVSLPFGGACAYLIITTQAFCDND